EANVPQGWGESRWVVPARDKTRSAMVARVAETRSDGAEPGLPACMSSHQTSVMPGHSASAISHGRFHCSNTPSVVRGYIGIGTNAARDQEMAMVRNRPIAAVSASHLMARRVTAKGIRGRTMRAGTQRPSSPVGGGGEAWRAGGGS